MHGAIPADRYFAYKTWLEIDNWADKENTVIIQPMGAIEQHGLHLPLAVDALICVEVIGRALGQIDPSVLCLVLPPLYYGKSNEHRDFVGTVCLSTDTMLKLLWEIGESIYRAGFRKLALVNAHGGQPQILELVARDLHEKYRDFWVFPLFIWRVPNVCAQVLSAQELTDGIHAGTAETSLLLEIEKDVGYPLVQMDRAVCEYPHRFERSLVTIEGANPYSWVTKDVSQSGVIGDATSASPELGQEIMDSLVRGWVQLLQDIYNFQPPKS